MLLMRINNSLQLILTMRTHTVIKIQDNNTESDHTNKAGEELRACRVCLATDIKLYNLRENHLSKIFEDITGILVLRSDGLPEHICSMCGMLLLKSWTFRRKCRQAHVFLQDIQVNKSQITLSYLERVDKKKFGFPLTTTNVLTLSYDINEENEENEREEEEEVTHEAEQVKKESVLDIGIPDDDFPDMNELNEENENIKYIFEVESEENSSEETSKSKAEDEKEKETEKKSEAKKELNEVKDKPVKRKRMYNSKTEEDFESFAKMYNVEVVFLTMEQKMEVVQARKESEDYIGGRFKCEECFKGFMKEGAFKRHMAWHDPSAGSYICEICRIRFKKRHRLLAHLRTHRMHFVCNLCNAISKSSYGAKLHYKWHDGFKYVCEDCGLKFNKQSSYTNHKRENHAAVTCDICKQDVSGTKGLIAHKSKVHSGMFKCTSCEAQFISEHALARHTELIAPHGCNSCMRPCSQCGEEFSNYRLLNKHMEKEHEDMIYRCEECNTTFSSDRLLGIHWSQVHKGRGGQIGRYPRSKGTFICEFCAKSFPIKTLLKYHQRIHTGEKPFPCQMCPKRFRMKTNLQMHENTHTGARPHKCPLCPESFKSPSQKHKHKLLAHTKERRHKCHLCEKTYVMSFDLKMHIRTFHMKIPLPPPNRKSRKNKKDLEQKNNKVVEQ